MNNRAVQYDNPAKYWFLSTRFVWKPIALAPENIIEKTQHLASEDQSGDFWGPWFRDSPAGLIIVEKFVQARSRT